MAEQIANGGIFKFVLRHGSPEEWNASTTVLAEGEPGVAVDPVDPSRTVLRVGDGLRAWPDLPDVAGGLPGLLQAAKDYTDQKITGISAQAWVGAVIGSKSLDEMTTPGLWTQQFIGNTSLDKGYPVAKTGSLMVLPMGSENRVQVYYPSTSNEWYQRNRISGAWGAWARFDSAATTAQAISASATQTLGEANAFTTAEVAKVKARSLPVGADLNSMFGADWHGMWSVASQARLDALLNRPSWMTTGDVIHVHAGIGFQLVEKYTNGGTPGLYFRARTSSSGSVWSEWRNLIGLEEKYTAGYAALAHKVRQDFARRRIGGSIGTGGKAAVALRFDDGHAAFRDKVLPLVQKYDLPSYQATTVTLTEEALVPWGDMQAWYLRDGVEVANHTRTHADSSGNTAIYDNTVLGADYMQTQMPHVLVDVWTMPSVGGTGFDGYDDGRYIPNFVDTTAGRVIMARHSVVNGYAGGRPQPMIGTPTVGQTHLTIDNRPLSEVQFYVKEAQQRGYGLTLMLHPSRLDGTTGRTTAELEEILAWIAAERDAERLLVLSAQGIAWADAGHAHRINFLRNGDFRDGLTGWTNAETYTIEDVQGMKVATTSTGVPLAQSLTVSELASNRGAVVELVARVNGATGDKIRTNIICGPTNKQVDRFLARSGWQEVRTLATIPTSVSVSSTLDVQIGRVSGGPVQLADIRLQTV